jgi:hypothetical protein
MKTKKPKQMTKDQLITAVQKKRLKISPLRYALLRLALTWDRLGPPKTMMLSGAPTASQAAWKILGVSDWEGES